MDDWMSVPTTDDDRQELVAKIQQLPTSIDSALDTLEALRTLLIADESYADIRLHQGAAESIKMMWRANKAVREQFDYTFLTGEWRIGQALLEEETAPGGQPYQLKSTGNPEVPVDGRLPTLNEKLGNKMYGWRMKMIAPLAIEALNSAIKELHAKDKEATLTGVVKLLRAEESKLRRWDSLTTPAVENGMELRIGDCRVVLSDIPDNSVPLILTDPPYEDGAVPLWEWLGAFAERVLIPGGSLICYFGSAHLNRLTRVLDDAGLLYWWQAVMLHDDAQRIGGKFVIASQKPILWYVKQFRRDRRLIADVVSDSKRDKSEHGWAQGDGGVRVWIHQLTDPGERVVDPFAGTARWGHVTCEAGRYWIGADIVKGGTTTVMAHDLEEGSE